MKKVIIGLVLALAAMNAAAVMADQTNIINDATTTVAKIKNTKSLLDADNIIIKSAVINLAQNTDNSAEVSIDLVNKSSRTIAIIAANSMTATQTLLHKTLRNNDKDKMKKINRLLVHPERDADLKDDGSHVMLIGLKQTLHKGDSVPVLLIFEDGSSMTAHAMVS